MTRADPTAPVGPIGPDCAVLSEHNRAILERMYAPAAFGRGCLTYIADGVRFRLIGDTRWSGTFRNKYAWAAQVFLALPRELSGPIVLTPRQILVEGDHACVRARGTALATSGRRYDNEYCLVYRFAGSCIVEATEYLDTELITYAFGSPAAAGMPVPVAVAALDRRPPVRPASYASSNAVSAVAEVAANKRLVSTLFASAVGDWCAAITPLLAREVVYHIAGSNPWSGTYRGRQQVVDEIFTPLRAALAGDLTLIADAIHGEADWVWVQARGLARTQSGGRYDNEYCLLLRIAHGAIAEVIVYLDTECMSRVTALR